MTIAVKCQVCGMEFLPAEKLKGQCPNCLVERMQQVVYSPDAADSGIVSSPVGARFQPPEPAELAAHFPQLEILKLIGQGGMGAVYQARQARLDRIVALKILPREVGDQGDFAGRFEREAKLLARLAHPNIVTIHDFGRAGDWYYFVMEYVDGVTLRDVVRDRQIMPRECLQIVSRICDAIQFAHEQGIVHRDIKPENILLDRRGNVKIADFGLAKLLLLAPDAANLTRTRQIMGTPHYMAPEQMDKSTSVDHRADIYSLGVVFYEMLTGELPLGRFDSPSKRAGLDARLDRIVLRALASEPGRRYQRASEMKSDVESLIWREPARGSDGSRIPWWKDMPGIFLAACSIVPCTASVVSAILVVGPYRSDRVEYAIFSASYFLISFVLARCLVGFAGTWEDFRLAQWLVVPPLMIGYVLLALVILLWPLLSITAIALAPTYAAIRPENWQLFGESYLPRAGAGAGINMYWFKVLGWGAVASAAWGAVVAGTLRIRPRLARRPDAPLNTGSLLAELLRPRPELLAGVFHPASPAAIRTGISYALLLVGMLVLPAGLLMLFIAYNGAL